MFYDMPIVCCCSFFEKLNSPKKDTWSWTSCTLELFGTLHLDPNLWKRPVLCPTQIVDGPSQDGDVVQAHQERDQNCSKAFTGMRIFSFSSLYP